MINRPCAMKEILDIADARDLRVIEDASQAIGVRYGAAYCGTLGDIGVFSFNRYKNMTCGEGGAVLTNDPALLARMVNAHDMGISFRNLPQDPGEIFVGHNFRISEIQGAILRVQLARLPARLRQMRRRTRVIGDLLAREGVSLAPENSPGDALIPAVTFDTEAEAKDFARRPAARCLHDNSKHVFTEWRPILERRMPHPKLDPWSWAGIAEDRALTDCPRTLDILRCSCAVDLRLRLPYPVFRAFPTGRSS
jgi:dTDP-4-amino-4,6-dideoxygalactose transaminase